MSLIFSKMYIEEKKKYLYLYKYNNKKLEHHDIAS